MPGSKESLWEGCEVEGRWKMEKEKKRFARVTKISLAQEAE